MFGVQPVRSRELQEQIATALGCDFFKDTYAFFAGEMTDDGTTVTSLIGLCQFTFDPTCSVIKSLTPALGCEEDEAMTILVRTVMYSVYRAEIPYLTISEDVYPVDKIKKMGFRKTEAGWQIDLKKFYESPCHYNAGKE
ncbi:MAG: hypothetical protein E7628_00180 [Ruminococcaceae bacterium]|nr:hypothetical protein [Oscillospiraceae bacterium]